MSAAPSSQDCTVLELRQYTLRPGQRETLIELFDREFVETQEAVGARVVGQFRDTDRADHFVWIRGFADMRGRADALSAFYTGQVWAAHSAVANATMIDSDDVLLLRPAWDGSGVRVQAPRPAPTATGTAAGFVAISVFPLDGAPSSAALGGAKDAGAILRQAGALDVGWYATEPAKNNFPRLPVREDVHVLVAVALFPDREVSDAFTRRGRWQESLETGLAAHLTAVPQTLHLVPTARSALRA